MRGLKQTHKIDLEATTNKEGKGFQVIPWRWAVERTFAWLLNDRRHSRDYERLTANSAAMIQISMIRLLLNLGRGCREEPHKNRGYPNGIEDLGHPLFGVIIL